ncbi:MAG: hypothetical protein QXF35_00890 [Candidatus Bilamarchaeaceae archaeon]
MKFLRRKAEDIKDNKKIDEHNNQKLQKKPASVFSKFMSSIFLIGLCSCNPYQTQKNFSCDPPSYVKVKIENNNEYSTKILAEGEKVYLSCGASLKIEKIEERGSVLYSVNNIEGNSSLQYKENNNLECVSSIGKSGVQFGLTGKKVALILLARNTNFIELKEGETIEVEGGDPLSKNDKVTLKFVRAFLTAEDVLVLNLEILRKDKKQPTKLFIEQLQASVPELSFKIPYTSWFLIGFSICEE